MKIFELKYLAVEPFFRQNGVENRIGDLIRDLVGVPFGHGLRGKEMPSGLEHGLELLRL